MSSPLRKKMHLSKNFQDIFQEHTLVVHYLSVLCKLTEQEHQDSLFHLFLMQTQLFKVDPTLTR